MQKQYDYLAEFEKGENLTIQSQRPIIIKLRDKPFVTVLLPTLVEITNKAIYFGNLSFKFF